MGSSVMSQLEQYQNQLALAESVLQQDPNNPQLKQLINDLKEMIDLTSQLQNNTQNSNINNNTLKRATIDSDQPDEDDADDGSSDSDDIFQDTSKPKAKKRKKKQPIENDNSHEIQKEIANFKVEVKGDSPVPPIESFGDAKFQSVLLNNVMSLYKHPTAIQQHAIPSLLQQRDIMATSHTGSGKTAAFLLPVIELLLRNPKTLEAKPKHYVKSFPVFLVLAPTRELAVQIHEDCIKFVQGTNIHCNVIYGGTSYQQQALELIETGCDILIATPGRLIDMLSKEKIDLKCVTYVCLDEADKMLGINIPTTLTVLTDMGFEKDIRNILNQLPTNRPRLTAMFSATFPKQIRSLAKEYLSADHLVLKVERIGEPNHSVKQEIRKLEEKEKYLQLKSDLNHNQGLTLVFVETKRGAESLCQNLQNDGYHAAAIHGDLSQKEREAALSLFKSGNVTILVATDVAARGLDIGNVTHVINYDVPQVVDDYIHRIGRTGRAGKEGHSITYFQCNPANPKHVKLAKDLCRVLGRMGQIIPPWLSELASVNHKPT